MELYEEEEENLIKKIIHSHQTIFQEFDLDLGYKDLTIKGKCLLKQKERTNGDCRYGGYEEESILKDTDNIVEMIAIDKNYKESDKDEYVRKVIKSERRSILINKIWINIIVPKILSYYEKRKRNQKISQNIKYGLDNSVVIKRSRLFHK